MIVFTCRPYVSILLYYFHRAYQLVVRNEENSLVSLSPQNGQVSLYERLNMSGLSLFQAVSVRPNIVCAENLSSWDLWDLRPWTPI